MRILKDKYKKYLFLLIIFGMLLYLKIDNNYPLELNPNPYIYKSEDILSISKKEIMNQIKHKNNVTFLHFYTTWCKACRRQFKDINELARDLQNLDVTTMIIAIDREIDKEKLTKYLGDNKIYFQPMMLRDLHGLSTLLQDNGIDYNKKIPFTAIIYQDKIYSYSGVQGKAKIARKISNMIDKDY